MFEKCSKIERSCGFCTISNYNPAISKYDDIKKEFCGVAGGYDTRVSSLPNCWLKMTTSQRTTYVKNKKTELQLLEIRSG